jgi:hypothetical protein
VHGWVWWVLAAVVVIAAADRLLLAAETRRWINYRRTPTHKGTGARALLGVQQILEPDKAHLAEVEDFEADRIEREAAGEPPMPKEESLAMEGTGGDGDLDEMRSGDDVPEW